MSGPLERTMGAQLTTRIRDRILSGAYAPGSPLLQDSIAAEFGVSKIPVREALVQLRAEGLVNVFAHRGFQVTPISAAEAWEIFRWRARIEPEAVAEGAKRSNGADHEAARLALEALGAAKSPGGLADAGDLNAAFHLALVVPRLQPVAAEILQRLHTLSRRYVRIHLQPAGRARRAAKEHSALHAAWAARKAREAARLSRAHIEETQRELLQALPKD